MFPLACLHVLYRTEVVDVAWLEEKPFSHRMAKTDAKASPARMTLQMSDGKRNVHRTNVAARMHYCYE
jgi:DNA primase